MNRIEKLAAGVKQASYTLAGLSRQQKDDALRRIAAALTKQADTIIAANKRDMEQGTANGMNESLLDRLMLDEKRIEQIAQGVLQVTELDDPIGEILSETTRPNGLRIRKVRVPLGVLGMIYEARPNVTVDAAALAIKSGNGIVLRGSSSAIYSNTALATCMQDAMQGSDVSPRAIGLVTDTARDAARQVMQLNEYIDALIPRGSAGLIREVVDNATVPVLKTGIGNCHVYIDKDADVEMAVPIVVNAKTSRPSVCNSAEKLLVHSGWPKENTVAVLEALLDAGVELRCDDRIRALMLNDTRLNGLPVEEYEEEYLDLIMGVVMVDDVAGAIAHINRYGSGHTETIITQSEQAAVQFLSGVDAAAVGHNVSTRFTDGFEYGFGAEIGISTQKLHARGPMGLKELTSYKYLVYGTGQIR